MTNIQVSIGLEQIGNFKNLLREKNKIYLRYLSNLKKEIQNRRIYIQQSKLKKVSLSVWLFSISIKKK